MQIPDDLLLLGGLALLLGYAIGRGTFALKITSIVGYILTGILLGPVLHVLKVPALGTDLVVNFTLSLIGFVIGGTFTLDYLREAGKQIWIIILGESMGAFLLVLLGTYLISRDLPLSLILAALAPASAPAGTLAAIRDSRASGPLTRAAIAVVGLDDATSIILFVVAIALVKVLLGGEMGVRELVLVPLREILGSMATGLAVGWGLSRAVRRVSERGNILILTLASLLLAAGLARVLHFSLILTSMFVGAALVNLAPAESKVSFQAVEGILPPVYVAFFILAGSELRPSLLMSMGLVGVVYIAARSVGLISGASAAAWITRAPEVLVKYLGFAILSQAGVAVGLSLLVASELSAFGASGAEYGTIAVTIISATTVFFEIVGPIGVRFAVTRAGEFGKG